MSTLTPNLLKEIALTVDLGERLTLIIVFGPGYLAEDGLTEIRGVMEVGHRVARHRLDRLGPNVAETVESAGASRPVVLVNGLERMPVERREQVQARMNLLRDTLNKLSAVVVMWIPVEIADEFRRLCADLFHWRVLTVYVDGPEHDERRLRHDYLVSLASATLTPPMALAGTQLSSMPVSAVGELRVRVAGEAVELDLDAWLGSVKRGFLRGPAGSGKTTALRRYAAKRALELLDDDAEVELPVFVAARWLNRQPIGWESLARAVEPTLDDEARSWLARRLATEPAILLLDGIDELPMYAQLLLFQADFFKLVVDNPRLRLVLSGRGLDESLDGWEEAEILPLDHATIERWSYQMGYDPKAVMAVLTSASADGLAMTPLLLQLLLFSRSSQPPDHDLTSLISNAVDAEIDLWDLRRARAPWSQRVVLTELANFAAGLTQNQCAAAEDSDLSKEMVDVLEFVAERSAIIWREEGRFGFTHRIFHDYFAGRWLAAELLMPDQFASYAADPAWRLPTLHALWFLSARGREAVIERIWEASDHEPPDTRWAMRMLVLRATLARHNPDLRTRFVQRAKDALEQARRDAEPPELWAPVADLVEHVASELG